jgi:hypothetical protein
MTYHQLTKITTITQTVQILYVSSKVNMFMDRSEFDKNCPSIHYYKNVSRARSRSSRQFRANGFYTTIMDDKGNLLAVVGIDETGRIMAVKKH